MFHMSCLLHAPVLHTSLTLIPLGLHVRCVIRAHVPNFALSGFMPHGPHTAQVLLCYVPRTLCTIMLLMPQVFQVSFALHSVIHRKSCGFVSCSSCVFGVLAILGFSQFILRLVTVVYNFIKQCYCSNFFVKVI